MDLIGKKRKIALTTAALILITVVEGLLGWSLLQAYRFDVRAGVISARLDGNILRLSAHEISGIQRPDLVLSIDADVLRLLGLSRSHVPFLQTPLLSRLAAEISSNWLSLKSDILQYRAGPSDIARKAILSKSEALWNDSWNSQTGSFSSFAADRNHLPLFLLILVLASLWSGLLLRMIFLVISERIEYHESRDSFTGLPNSGAALDCLDREIRVSERYGRNLALLVFEIDHFAEYAQSHDETVSGLAVRSVAKIVRFNIRKSDFLARTGGATFSILSRESGEGHGVALAGKLHHLLSGMKPRKGDAFTVSFGIADFRPGDSAEALYARAETALTSAREAGGNHVVFESIPNPKPEEKP